MKKKRDHSAIFIETVKLNNLTYNDIVFICERSESTVFKWFSGRLVIDAYSLCKIRLALGFAKLIIPRELSRLCGAEEGNLRKWARRNISQNEKPIYVGEKLQEPTVLKFKYGGQLLSRVEISALSGKKLSTILGRTRTFKYGEEVTDIINKHIKRGRKKKTP